MTLLAEISRQTVEEYHNALSGLGLMLSLIQRAMLIAHSLSPDRTTTASRLAAAVGFDDPRCVVAEYRRLGMLIGEQLELPADQRGSCLLMTPLPLDRWGNREGRWVLHEEVRQAITELGWIGPAD